MKENTKSATFDLITKYGTQRIHRRCAQYFSGDSHKMIRKLLLTTLAIFLVIEVNCQLREVKITNPNIIDAISIYLDSVTIDKRNIGVIAIEFTYLNRYALDSGGRAKVDMSGTFSIRNVDHYYIRYLQPNVVYYFGTIPVIITTEIDRIPIEDPKHTKRILKQLRSSLSRGIKLNLTVWFEIVEGKLATLIVE